ncbi:hypothetical protein MRB53_022192 [Persea americana]|uniref:Uncharacterized protein n=1 Tax=Persea americana TaxID=3435 RepID=A0ACC2L602_PERAE|nr:hypothetical protein MRB53_022192 [Persea americana]
MYLEQTPHSHSKIAAFCSCGGVKNTIPSPASTVLRTELELWLRALPIRILTIGKKRSKGIQLIDEEYREKLKCYCSVDDVQIKSNPKNTSDVKAQIEGEDNIITQHIRSEDWTRYEMFSATILSLGSALRKNLSLENHYSFSTVSHVGHPDPACVSHWDISVQVAEIIASLAHVVVLDERGLDIGSEEMAELVGDAGKTHKNCKEGS